MLCGNFSHRKYISRHIRNCRRSPASPIAIETTLESSSSLFTWMFSTFNHRRRYFDLTFWDYSGYINDIYRLFQRISTAFGRTGEWSFCSPQSWHSGFHSAHNYHFEKDWKYVQDISSVRWLIAEINVIAHTILTEWISSSLKKAMENSWKTATTTPSSLVWWRKSENSQSTSSYPEWKTQHKTDLTLCCEE